MTRPTRALIDRGALRHNLDAVRRRARGCRVLAVVKADAYGHGQDVVTTALEPDGFAVARVHEGLALREAGVSRPVVVLSGAWSVADMESLGAAGLDVVVHHEAQLAALAAARPRSALRVWLKVDTGMHRLGFEPAAVGGVLERLASAEAAAPDPVLMTHLANADDRRDLATRRQLESFAAAGSGIEAERSAANSAGILGWPDSHHDWVRPGIMLYGISPFTGSVGADQGLRAAMTLETRLVAVNHRRRGDAIGYGGAWVCPEDMPVGTAAIGYGDGYPRHAPSGTPVLVGGRRATLVGRVSMDLITLDLRSCPSARPGDRVVLWGPDLPVEEVAGHAGTIGYELVSRLGPRVERVVID